MYASRGTDFGMAEKLLDETDALAAGRLRADNELALDAADAPHLPLAAHFQGDQSERIATIGTLSTGHVAAGSLKQALGPALVFELCKVI